MLYYQYGMQFLSPLINVQVPPYDFIKFCKNLDYYLSLDLKETQDYSQDWISSIGLGKIDFPVGKLGDITIYFVHYKTFKEAYEAWNRRKKRVNKRNIFVVLFDVNPNINKLEEFNKLKYKHKLYMYYKGHFNDENAFYVKGLENTNKPWYAVMENEKIPYYQQFDFRSWFDKK